MSVLPRILSHNASLKASALAAAVFLWAIAPTDRTQRESLSSVPVRVQVADPNWTLAEDPFPGEVEVRFSGSTRDLLRIAREGTAVRVPIEVVLDADTTLPLRRDWVVLDGSSGLVVEEILPGSVDLAFEPVASVALPIELRVEGRLPEGLALASPLGVTPGVVRARGPARILNRVDSLPTLPLDLSSVGASGVRTLQVDTTGLGGALLDPLEVTVGIRVDGVVERLLPEVPIRLIGPGAEEYEVDASVMEVTLHGAEVRFQSASLDSVAVVIDTRDIGLLGVGESRSVEVSVTGVPELLVAIPARSSVTVSRPDEELGGPTSGPGGRRGGGR